MSDSFAPAHSVVASLIAAIAVSIALFFVCRWIGKQSRRLGHIVQLGILVRTLAGLTLFGISFFNLPFLAGWHTGDGFWRLAPDAKGYYLEAVRGAKLGFHTISGGTPSFAFVEALSIWMTVVGTSPLSALLFNLASYVALCGALVLGCRSVPERWRARAGALVVTAFTCSPMLILYGTQPLKDPFFGLLAVVAALAARSLATTCSRAFSSWRELLFGIAGLASAIYLMAGMRAYYPFLACVCLSVLFGASAMSRGRAAIGRAAIVGVSTCAVAWLAFVWGAQDYARQYESLLTFRGAGRHALVMLTTARTGFIRTGGASNVTDGEVPVQAQQVTTDVAEERLGSADNNSAPPQGDAEDPASRGLWKHRVPVPPISPVSVQTRLQTRVTAPSDDEASMPATFSMRALTVGLATLFVPMSMLRGLSIVHITVGRGMLLVTDLDTLFLDATLGLGLLFLIRARASLTANVGFLAFTVSLAILLGGLMSYAVTNYGTLVRLRLMLGFTMWTLPLALGRPDGADLDAGARSQPLASPST